MTDQPELKSLTEVNAGELDGIVDEIRELARVRGAMDATQYERLVWGLIGVVGAVILVPVAMGMGDPSGMLAAPLLVGAVGFWRAHESHKSRIDRWSRARTRLYASLGQLAYRFDR